MEITEIKLKKRDKIGKQYAKKYRKSNLIPGVVYGAHLKENIHVLVEKRDLWDLIRKGHSKEQHVLRLIIEDGENTITENAILQDVQIDPIKDDLLHVDFHAVSLEEVVDVYVPVVLVGEPKGVKQGGILQHGVEEILIRALPLDVPPHIEVDITDLEIGDSITVGDLNLPENIKVLTPADEVIVNIIPPKGYTEETSTEESQTESQS